MDKNYIQKLQDKQKDIESLKELLSEIGRLDHLKTFRLKPLISMMETGCSFLNSNIEIIKKHLSKV